MRELVCDAPDRQVHAMGISGNRGLSQLLANYSPNGAPPLGRFRLSCGLGSRFQEALDKAIPKGCEAERIVAVL